MFTKSAHADQAMSLNPGSSIPDYSHVYGTRKSFPVYGSFTTECTTQWSRWLQLIAGRCAASLHFMTTRPIAIRARPRRRWLILFSLDRSVLVFLSFATNV